MDTGELGTSGQDSTDSPNPHSAAWLKPICCPTRGAISHNLFGLCIFRYKPGADGTFPVGAGQWCEGNLCRPWHTVGI